MRESRKITAIVPYGVDFSTDPDTADRQRAVFMERAQNAIVEVRLLGINRMKLDNVETILRCFTLDDADTDERGDDRSGLSSVPPRDPLSSLESVQCRLPPCHRVHSRRIQEQERSPLPCW